MYFKWVSDVVGPGKNIVQDNDDRLQKAEKTTARPVLKNVCVTRVI